MQTYQSAANMLQAAAVAAAAAAAQHNNNNNNTGSNNNNLFNLQQQQYQQELVIKSYLNQQQQQQQQQQNASSSLMSPASSNHSAASVGGQAAPPASATAPGGGAANSMVSLAGRLMALTPYELKCLNSDNELMRRIQETQMLIESRLQELHNNNNNSNQNTKLGQQHQKQMYQQHMLSPLDLNLKEEQQQQFLQQQQTTTTPSDNHYYQNYYAQQLFAAQQQMAQQYHHQQQQQQQFYLLNTRYNNSLQTSQNMIDTAANNLMEQATTQMSKHHHHLSDSTNGVLGQKSPSAQQHQHHLRPGQPALDLRTTPTRPISISPLSPLSSRAGSTGSAASAGCNSAPRPPQQQQQQHPKKAKLSEYRKQNNDLDQNHRYNDTQNSSSTSSKQRACAQTSKQTPATSGPATCQSGANNVVVVVKKYKGEFDEPTPDEVGQRQLQLNRPNHYHKHALERGECACVIGSEFSDKTKQEALELLDNWRALDIEERIKWKWDVSDLPKDIPLSDIKKFEDLRRDFSEGRADFGGASKRKPLGIRGTRQFLLMLYCLWGHPGREDPMQQDGYCPHCFARIRTENEQSTLVRVVNHFNMKHRRGANPRLSPRLEAAAAASQFNSIANNVSKQNKLKSIGEKEDENDEEKKGRKRAKIETVVDGKNTDAASSQSPQLEVARTLLSMVESATTTPAAAAMNNVNKCNNIKKESKSEKLPEMDSENLDPCSTNLNNDDHEQQQSSSVERCLDSDTSVGGGDNNQSLDVKANKLVVKLDAATTAAATTLAQMDSIQKH